MTKEIDTCPVCTEPLHDDDICASDMELGICHAECLEGSPTVDLNTGEPVEGPVRTYPYGDTDPATPSLTGTNADPCRAPLCDCSMGATERCGRPGGAADPARNGNGGGQ